MERLDKIDTLDKMETLEDRMKKYETENEYKIKSDEAYIIRLDGKCFSNFTKKFNKPFDINFVKAMAITTQDLVKKFDAQTGYTHSDEISLIFNSKCINQDIMGEKEDYIDQEKINITNHFFDGRINKILTLISSYCSVRFNYNLAKIVNQCSTNTYSKELIDLVNSNEQIFDARILKFSFQNIHEILNHQIWRVKDCNRNSILTYGYTHCGKKNINGKKCTEIIKMLKEIGIDYDNIPMFLKYGLYCKKILREKEYEGTKFLRSEYVFKQFKINFSQDNLNMLLNKYWIDDNEKVSVDLDVYFDIKNV